MPQVLINVSQYIFNQQVSTPVMLSRSLLMVKVFAAKSIRMVGNTEEREKYHKEYCKEQHIKQN